MRKPLLVFFNLSLALTYAGQPAPPKASPFLDKALPLAFEVNQGQAAQPGVNFIAHGQTYSVLLSADRLRLQLKSRGDSQRVNSTELTMRLGNRPSRSVAEGLDRLPGSVNYFLGNSPKGWHTDVPTFRKVSYKEVYPGIQLVYYGTEGKLEYDFIAAPGADPKRICLQFSGGKIVGTDPAGGLRIETAAGEVAFQQPVAYQESHGRRIAVQANYAVGSGGNVRFKLGRYDRRLPLVIDPTLAYSGVVVGNNINQAQAIAVDSLGNTYIAGYTYSTDLPVINTVQPANQGCSDAFVMKINAAGTAILYSTYLGGSNCDIAYSVAADNSGNAYITGSTQSSDFPLSNPSQPTNGGGSDAFVAKIGPSGSVLVYSTYVGGNSTDIGYGIAVDKGNGNAYVTGSTASSNFPVLSAFQAVPQGGQDAFLTKFDTNGVRLFSTYLGGNSSDTGRAVAVDGHGSVYVAGETFSSNFPVTLGVFQPALHGSKDAFIAKFGSTGTRAYATYLGGSGDESALGIAVQSTSGTAYITGTTTSGDFPLLNPIQPTYGGGGDAFITRLSADATSLVYSTYVGGGHADSGNAIAVEDATGNAAIAGSTNSRDIPILNALQPARSGVASPFYQSSNLNAWSAADSGLTATQTNVLSVDPTSTAVSTSIVIGTSTGVFRTTSGNSPAATWSPTAITSYVYALARGVSSPATLYSAISLNGISIVKSTDGGQTWSFPVTVAGVNSISSLVVNPQNSAIVYAASNIGVFRSADGGATWLLRGFGGTNIFTLAIDPVNPLTLYAGTQNGPYRSDDAGVTWTPKTSVIGAFTFVLSFDIDRNNAAVVYAVGSVCVYKSSNRGDTWSLLGNSCQNSGVSLVRVAANSTTVCGAGSAGVVCSFDSGATWAPAPGPIGVQDLAFHPALNTTAFIGTALSANDAFVTKLSSTGSLLYSTFLGGSAADDGFGIAADQGNIYVTGTTGSTDFVITPANFIPANQRGFTGFFGTGTFVAKISDSIGTCAASASPGSTFVYGFGGSAVLSVIAPSGCAWTAPAPPSWVTYTGPSSGIGLGRLSASVGFNPGASTRSSTIFGSTIVQAANCSYSISPTLSPIMPAAGGSANVTITAAAGCDWVVSNNPAWLTVTPNTGTGTGSVTVNFAPNTSPNARSTGTVIASQTYSVSQSGTCAFSLSPAIARYSNSGGVSTFNVTTGSLCSWFPNQADAWLTLPGQGFFGNTGSGAFTVTALANSGSTRTSSVRVFNAGVLVATLPVTQGFPLPDFNQDGHNDVIWQDPVTGLAQVWFLGGAQGTSVVGAANLTASNSWRIVGVGDFNGDGLPDVVWQDPVTGAAQVWFLGGLLGNVVTGAAALNGGNSWRIMSIADFNGDGHPDLIWQDPVTGLAQIWFMGGPQGTSLLGAVNLTAGNTWRIVGTGDFNEDGHPDVLWQDPVSGATQVWYLGGAQGNVVTSAANLAGSNSWRIASVGDFNGDGLPDVVWQNPVSGTSQVWFLGGPQGTTITGSAALSGDNAWRIAGPR